MMLTPWSSDNGTMATIQGEEFGAERTTGGDGFSPIKRFAKYSGCETVLRDSLEALGGITPYRLGKLLGMANPQNAASNWFEGRHRPSQLYMVRILKLHHLAMAGVRLLLVDKIDWERGEIKFRQLPDRKGDDKANGAYQDSISYARRQIQDEFRGHKDPVGQFLAQRPGLAGPRPDRGAGGDRGP